MIALYVSLAGLLGVLPTLAYDPAATGCMSCRANLLGLADGPGVVADLSRWGTRLALLAIAACVGLSLWRLARAPSVRRRRAGPLVMPGCAYLALVAAELGHAWRPGLLSDPIDQTLWTLQAAALLGVAAGVGLLLAAARRRRARLARLVVELAGAPRPGGLRDALADTLGDPSLELLHAGSMGEDWIDTTGCPRTPRPGAATTALVRDGEPIALLCHRAGLLDESGMVNEIERSVRLGLDHERLQAQLRRQLAHLRSSRADVTEAGEAERRLLERVCTTAPSNGLQRSPSRSGSPAAMPRPHSPPDSSACNTRYSKRSRSCGNSRTASIPSPYRRRDSPPPSRAWATADPPCALPDYRRSGSGPPSRRLHTL